MIRIKTHFMTTQFLLVASIIFLVACQSEAPKEAAKECPAAPKAEAPKCEAPPAAAPAGPAAVKEEVPAEEAPVAPTPGEPSEFAGKVIPADVDWFGSLNVKALKGTLVERQFRPWLGYLDGIPEYKKVMAETGAGELIGHTIVVGGTFAPHTKLGFDAVGAVFGLESGEKMSSWVANNIAKKGPPPAREFTIGHKDGGLAWMAGPSLVVQVKALLDGTGKSVNDDDAWVELQRGINTKAPLWAVVKVPELVRAQFPLLHAEVPGLKFFPGVTEILGTTHAAMSIDMGDRLEVRAAIKLQTAEDAVVVQEQLQLAAEATLWDPSLFFDVFQLQADGSLVTFNAATSEKAWRITVFWLSIAAQGVAMEEMRESRWEAEMMEEKAEMEMMKAKAMEEAMKEAMKEEAREKEEMEREEERRREEKAAIAPKAAITVPAVAPVEAPVN